MNEWLREQGSPARAARNVAAGNEDIRAAAGRWVDPAAIHTAVICVGAPDVALSGPDGQLRGGGNHGFYREDRRLLSRLMVIVDGREPEPIVGEVLTGSRARFVAVAHEPGNRDPTLTVERMRGARPISEEIRVSNFGRAAVCVLIEILVASDLAEISQVSAGKPLRELPLRIGGGGLTWESDGLAATLTVLPPPQTVDPIAGVLGWILELQPGQVWEARLSLAVASHANSMATIAAPPGGAPWSVPRISCADPRLPQLLERSLSDLQDLLLADPLEPADVFLAAGSPWYLTLFGRDSLWAARMLLPLGTELAGGTLRTLARRQGRRRDRPREEELGKILHELRPAPRSFDSGMSLPAQYYGTIDATPLFITLLGEARRWGMPDAEVADLLPAAEQALHWLARQADPDGDGFVQYRRSGSAGLANHGWKDSHDSIQYADGRLAKAPIALCEVQGYAYEAALHGADLLDAFGKPGASNWRAWAESLRDRFREAFWIDDTDGPYPAIALDARKRPVDGVASNMGHLLGTGILNTEECGHIAKRLGSPEMDSGWGLRTLSSASRGFNPLSYHCGSVWPHDTAIAVSGLAATGHHEQAAALLCGLLAAAPAFGHRLPELYAGERRAVGQAPLPYPAACRPQAWAAAAGVSLVQSVLGVRPDVPAGRVGIHPLHPAPFDTLHITGMRIAGKPFSVRLDHGALTIEAIADGFTVDLL